MAGYAVILAPEDLTQKIQAIQSKKCLQNEQPELHGRPCLKERKQERGTEKRGKQASKLREEEGNNNKKKERTLLQ